jgi:D-xylose transport system substrate-binding protein
MSRRSTSAGFIETIIIWKGEIPVTSFASTKTGAAALAFCLLGGTSVFAQSAKLTDATIAFLMPDQASTRYEQHDYPGFAAEMKKLCPGCKVIYQNADADVSRQQQQFNSVIAQGAKAIVLDPVSFNNEGIGKAIADSLVQHLKASNVPAGEGGVLQINGSPTDAAAGLIKKGIHAGLNHSGYPILAEYDTPEWAPPKAQQWASGQITRFGNKILGVVAANDGTGGGAIAAFKAAGVDPLPPITGNDATIAALQLIIAGDQYNTISKPSEIVAAAAAKVAVQLLSGETPKAEMTLYDTPSQLFTPAVVTAENLKAEIIDKKIIKAEELCTGRYAEGCKKLGIN